MKKFLILFISLLIIKQIIAQEIVLNGIFKQGGFCTAILPDDVIKCEFNDKEIPIYNGYIFCGFKKEQSLKNTLVLFTSQNDTIQKFFKIQKVTYPIQEINNIPKKYVEKPKNKSLQDRINKEYNTLLIVRESIIYKNRRKFFDNFNLPLIYRISSKFGFQRVVNGKPSGYHKGIDFAAPKGADVLACANGIVVLTGDYFYNGKFVLIDHGLGVSSIYIHLSKIDVLIGQFVSKGEKIGEVGSTGKSTGNHLHWGVYWYQYPINPLFISSGITQIKILR